MIISGILFALLLGAFVFLLLPRGNAWQRTASAAIYLMLIGVVYAGSVEMLSRPKPLRLEWRSPAKAKVLGATMHEGKAIYVWLQVGDSPEPRSYVLPWNMQMAQQIQDAMRRGHAEGTAVEVSSPFGSMEAGTEGAKPRFYAKPQEALPPKNYSAAHHIDFQRSEAGATR
jgi:hypothetical protein